MIRFRWCHCSWYSLPETNSNIASENGMVGIAVVSFLGPSPIFRGYSILVSGSTLFEVDLWILAFASTFLGEKKCGKVQVLPWKNIKKKTWSLKKREGFTSSPLRTYLWCQQSMYFVVQVLGFWSGISLKKLVFYRRAKLHRNKSFNCSNKKIKRYDLHFEWSIFFATMDRITHHGLLYR